MQRGTDAIKRPTVVLTRLASPLSRLRRSSVQGHLRRLAGAASMLDVSPKAAIKERIENGDEEILVSCCGGVRDATRAKPMARALHKKSATR